MKRANVKLVQSNPSLVKLSAVRLPRRGRGQVINAQALGTVTPSDSGGDHVDTSPLQGYPVGELYNLAREQGFDPSQAMAEGINNLLADKAREAAGGFDLQRKVTESGLVADPDSARLTAVYLRQVANRIDATPDEIIDALKEIVQSHKS